MHRFFVLVAIVSVSAPALAQDRVTINVPAGDQNALFTALQDANDPAVETVIRTTGEFRLAAASRLPTIRTRVTLEGHPEPAFFRGAGENAGELLEVSQDGFLQLHNLEFADITLNGTADGFIDNHGELLLTKVQFTRVAGNYVCGGITGCSSVAPGINNRSHAQLTIRQSSFVDSGVALGLRTPPLLSGLILNHGTADIRNSQFFLPTARSGLLVNHGFMALNYVSIHHTGTGTISLEAPVLTATGAHTEVGFSVISGFLGTWCDRATSLGHNLVDAEDCGLGADTDLVGLPAGLLWRPTAGNWTVGSDVEILTHALVPAASSPAVDSIASAACSANEEHLLANLATRFVDGDGDGIAACDRGAVELFPVTLQAGGINGLYWVPEADNHYVYVLDNDFNTLVVWTTFDRDGNQAWVYGVGELVAGRSLTAQTFINLDGRIAPDGSLEAATDEPWGTMQLDMESCREGMLSYRSDRPEFGSGQFRIVRLVSVKQLGCVD